MRIWALTESGQMFQVKLKVPRAIYINSKVICSDPEFKKMNNKSLPRNRKVYNLYEWEKSEDLYQEKFHSLAYHHLLSHTVEGVYETKMPLLFKAVMELGCIVRPRTAVIPRHE
jgi:DNA polymerase epsilon subunit 1